MVSYLSAYGRDNPVKRTTIKADGSLKEFTDVEINIRDSIDAYKRKEGCRVEGHLFIHLAQPAIIFGPSGLPPPLLLLMMAEIPDLNFNLSHKINSFFIGPANDCESSMNLLDRPTDSCHGLRGVQQMEDKKPSKRGLFHKHTYFLNVIHASSGDPFYQLRARFLEFAVGQPLLFPVLDEQPFKRVERKFIDHHLGDVGFQHPLLDRPRRHLPSAGDHLQQRRRYLHDNVCLQHDRCLLLAG